MNSLNNISIRCYFSNIENINVVSTDSKHYVTFDIKLHGFRCRCFSNNPDVIAIITDKGHPNDMRFEFVGDIGTSVYNDRYYNTFYISNFD